MSTRIRNFFKTNLIYKIVAFLLASALWLLVYNIEDPTKTTTFTIPVTITGSDVLEDMNKCYEIAGGSGQVTFAVSAKRTTLEKISAADFSATADMNRMTISENGRIGTIPVDISTGRYVGSVKLSSRAKYIDVALEDMAVKQFVVSAATKGNVAEGYALGSVTVYNPNVLKVSGPVSMVQSVDKVTATIDVEGMSQTISDNVVPVLYNEAGEEINSNRLKLSNTTVTVQAAILNTKQIPLRFSTSGDPADGYHVGSVTASAETVWVKGPASELNQIADLAVPSSVINVTDSDSDVVTTIDISEYLPEGVELLDKSYASVTITVEIRKSASKNFSVPVSAIQIIGLAEGMEVQYNASAVNVTITGTDEDLASLSQIKGTVDASGVGAGTHFLPVAFALDEKYSCSPVRVSFTISDPKTEDNQEANE